MCVCVCEYNSEKTQDIHRMILYIVELFAKVSVYHNTIIRALDMRCFVCLFLLGFFFQNNIYSVFYF